MTKYKIALIGNPNVGKSTVFNALTGLNHHTGNWAGKTVDSSSGTFTLNNNIFEIYDLPGTYSVFSNSPEEQITRDFISFNECDLTLIIADATCIERNLNLALQICELCDNVLMCVNLLDEASKNKIKIDTEKLNNELNIPVIGICAKRKKDINKLKSTIAENCINKSDATLPLKITYPHLAEDYILKLSEIINNNLFQPHIARLIAIKLIDNKSFGIKLLKKYTDDEGLLHVASESRDQIVAEMSDAGIPLVAFRDIVAETVVNTSKSISGKCISIQTDITQKTEKIDKLLTSKVFAFPIMILFFCLILWITIVGANYPSDILSDMFAYFKPYLENIILKLNLPLLIHDILIDGIYDTTACVVSVMLPPMAIFFPLFTLLEDSGFLPRIAFNLDKCFCKIHSTGKQALTMCMGLGCNAVGVTGCRIMSSPSERLVSIITNSFIPCNGKFGMLTTLSTIFVGGFVAEKYSSSISAIFVFLLIMLGIFMTFCVCKILNKTIIKNTSTDFILELPPYRKPQILKTLIRSLLDRTLIILGRAISVAAPAGAFIWICSNVCAGDKTILAILSDFLNPFAEIIGLDGVILLAFILSFPANETVLPIILMGYTCSAEIADATSLSFISETLIANNWTFLTALNVMIFSVLHFPCATTLKTIKAETGSIKWTILAFILPTLCGLFICFLTNLLFNIIS